MCSLPYAPYVYALSPFSFLLLFFPFALYTFLFLRFYCSLGNLLFFVRCFFMLFAFMLITYIFFSTTFLYIFLFNCILKINKQKSVLSSAEEIFLLFIFILFTHFWENSANTLLLLLLCFIHYKTSLCICFSFVFLYC